MATFLCMYWVFICVFPCISLWFLWGFRHGVTLWLVLLLMLYFSLMTTLFCFISLDTLLATFLCLYWVFMCVFSCVSLHLGEAFCIMSHRDLFLCCCCCCCSFLTRHNSLLFYFIWYIIGNFFVFVLSIYVCVFLHLSVSWWGFLHHVTLQLVSLLMLLISHSWQLSLFYFIRYIIGNFFVVVLSVYVCVSLCLSASSLWGFLHGVTLWLVSLLLLLLFFLTHGTHRTCGMSSDWSERCWQIYCN